MNEIPVLSDQYDFCWSICALEHLGSIQNGLDFIENSLSLLKPGGIAIHTTEFNYASDLETIEHGLTVMFRRMDFEALKERLERKGHRLLGPDYFVGKGVLDKFVDLPPFFGDEGFLVSEQWPATQPAHLKLALDGFPSTCMGLIIQKNSTIS